MRAVIQRVSESTITIDKAIHSQIKIGLLVLIGIESEDNHEDINWMANKIGQMRIFSDAEGKMNNSIVDINGELLVVSQFTLHASTKKGNRPSFIKAAKPDIAIPLYQAFVHKCGSICTTKTGVFGADMKIDLINDGPVTIILDSKRRE